MQDGQAVIRLRVVGPPIGERPRIAVGPDRQFGTTPEEHDRIAREATRAAVLTTEARLAQARLLERLARIAPEGQLRFAHVAKLERFLAATAALDDASAEALPDEDLLTLWGDAERPGGGNHSREGEE